MLPLVAVRLQGCLQPHSAWRRAVASADNAGILDAAQAREQRKSINSRAMALDDRLQKRTAADADVVVVVAAALAVLA